MLARTLLALGLTLGLTIDAHAQVSFGGGAEKTEATDPTVCTGENLVTTIGRERPEAMARIDAKAEAMPYGEGKFWRLSKPGVRPSTLYGTMHVADERATALSDDVRRAIAGSDIVALEIAEIADPAALQAKMSGFVAQSLYLDRTTLTSRLSAEQVALLKDTLAKRGPVPWAAAERMRPWLLMAAMSLPACETARKAAKRPVVDQLIAQLAEKAGRDVIGLETVKAQVDVMSGLPEPLMLRALNDVALLGERMDDVFETTVALYETGDIAKVWALMQDPVLTEGLADGRAVRTDAATMAERAAGYAAFQRDVIDRRNANMVEALVPLLEAGNAFAAVGALHLPGEAGMLRLLERQGWAITALD